MSVYIRRRDSTTGRRYDVAYRLHGRYGKIGHAGTFKSEREAKIRKRKVENWIAEAKDPGVELRRFLVPNLTVGEVAEQWLRSKRRIKPRTLAEYQRHTKVISDAFPGQASALTVADVDEWISDLSAKHRPGTVIGYMVTLRAILDHLDGENVARNRRLELPRRDVRVLEPPDATATLNVIANVTVKHRQVMVLMEQCGLRVSEACAVQPQHFDHAGYRLLVPVTKTGRPRWVPVPEWLLGLLKPPWRGNRQAIHNALKAACVLAEVNPFGPHMLRHRRASLWHAQGVTPVDAAAWLGHSVKTYLSTYTHVMPVSEIDAHRLALLLR